MFLRATQCQWMRLLCCAFVLFLALAVDRKPGDAQVARVEAHPIQSTTLTDQEFLTGRKDGKSVILAGQLRIPTPGTDRLPVIVLVHGSGGPSGREDEWAQHLNRLGVAAFILDSFTGRGLISTSADQARLGRLAMIVDIYRVLELLARHPRIDDARIAVMGFSEPVNRNETAGS